MRKRCPRCNRILPRERFYRNVNRYDGLQSWCKDCKKAYKKDKYKQDASYREQQKVASQKYRAKNRTKIRAMKKSANFAHSLKNKYGVSLEWYQDKMKNGCDVCKSSNELLIDRSQATGTVRGVLCNSCNNALALLNDDPVLVERLLRYLWLSSPLSH